MIFLFDVVFSLLSFILSNYILNEFRLNSATFNFITEHIPYIIFARAIAFLIFDTHATEIKHTSIRELLGIFVSTGFGTILIFVGNLINIYTFHAATHLSISLLITDLLCVFFILTTYRLIIKGLYILFFRHKIQVKNAVIYGIDEKGLLVKKFIDVQIKRLNIVAFLDHNEKNKGKLIENTPIYMVDELDYLINTLHVSHLLIPKTLVSHFNKLIHTQHHIDIKLVEFPDIDLNAVQFNTSDYSSYDKTADDAFIDPLKGHGKGNNMGNNFLLN